jgi:hypothetical protein
MPVHRFRSADEMNQPRWREPGDPELHRAIASLWSFGQRTVVRRFPPGVYKHRSIENLNEQTEKWAVANFETFQRTRREPAAQNRRG